LYSTNCSSGSNFYWTPVAGVLVVSLTVHGMAVTHGIGHSQLPPQEHTELSSKSTASVDIHAARFGIDSSGSTLPSSALTIRY
jgi:hypothetical protein